MPVSARAEPVEARSQGAPSVSVANPARPEPVEGRSPGRPSAAAANTVRLDSVEGRAASSAGSNFKDALLAEIKKGKSVFYNMVVAQAQKIEIVGDRLTFTFSPSQRALRDSFEQNRAWLEALVLQIGGRRIAVAAVQTSPGDAASAPPVAGQPPGADKQTADRKSALREQALADAGVQTMLDVFPAEIRDVEEM